MTSVSKPSNYYQPDEPIDPTYDPNRIPTSVSETNTAPVPKTSFPSFSQTPSAYPTNEPRTVTEPPVTETESDRTATPYITKSQMIYSENEQEIVTEIGTETPVPSTAPLTFSQPRQQTRRPTRKPITTTSVQTTTTKSKTLQVEFWKDTPLKSVKYDCNWFGKDCEWKPMYKKILGNTQGR